MIAKCMDLGERAVQHGFDVNTMTQRIATGDKDMGMKNRCSAQTDCNEQ